MYNNLEPSKLYIFKNAVFVLKQSLTIIYVIIL